MSEFRRLAESVEYQALLETSARIGSNPDFVQGPGGNTSIKTDRAMWIKASGTWLADALTSEIMVPVQLDSLLSAIQAQHSSAESAIDYVPTESNPNQLRPSIETTVHAVLPGAVVLHDHCVETIALAVRQDARQETQRRLNNFDAVYVPYTKPGLNLARSILDAVSDDTRVVVLGNHGLVVSADTVAEAESLLTSVASQLSGRLHPGIAPHDELPSLAAGIDYEPAQSMQSHALALDPQRLAIAMGGSLYPDHVIFLGRRVAVVSQGQSIKDALKEAIDKNGVEPILLLVEDRGALVHAQATAAQLALVQCLGDVVARLDFNAPLTTLTDEESNALLDWDAEKYRQSLDNQD